MKKTMVILMATSLFAAAAPVMAMDMDHGAMHNHQQQDAQCVKECDMLLKNCSQQATTIQEQVRKLQSALQNKGNTYTRDQLKTLQQKLDDTQKFLIEMQEGGA